MQATTMQRQAASQAVHAAVLLSAKSINFSSASASLPRAAFSSRRPGNRVCRAATLPSRSFVRGVPLARAARPLSRRSLSTPVRCSVSEQEPRTATEDKKSEDKSQESVDALLTELPEPLKFVKASDAQLAWTSFRLRFALPWRRVPYKSVLKFELGGELGDKLPPPFSGSAGASSSLPQVCQNLIKAAHDPRIEGIYIKLTPLACGWAKIEELVRHLRYFNDSGKFSICYLEVGGEKEYVVGRACKELYAPPSAYLRLKGLSVTGSFLGGVLEKLGVQPQIKRIGKFKSAGDQLSRRDMSDANREMLSAILGDVYAGFVDKAAALSGKSAEQVTALVEEGVFEMARYMSEGWIDGLKYDDEIMEELKARTGGKPDTVRGVLPRRYNRVPMRALGLAGPESIAILRATGSISRGKGPGDGIRSDTFIALLRRIKEDKKVKAVVVRIDSGGGDALASDLMWREIRQLALEKPVVASMADVCASGGYYMAMACQKVVAEPLTLTGSIGVVTGRFALGELFSRVGFNQETISVGKYAQLDNVKRPLSPEEDEWFERQVAHAYKSFRDKAAASRNMEVEAMEAVAQGRVWTGAAAHQRGLVDYLGGIHTAVAVAKRLAKLPDDSMVSLVELSRAQMSPAMLLRGGTAMISSIASLAALLQRVTAESASVASGVPQARLDDAYARLAGSPSSADQLAALLGQLGEAELLLQLLAGRQEQEV